MFLRRPWSLIVFLGACGGACGGTSAETTTSVTTAMGSGSNSGSGSAAGSAAAGAPQPAPLSEAMAVPYFDPSSPSDAGVAARAFALEQWQPALDGFTKARLVAKGDDIPRLELLLGLTEEGLRHWAAAVPHLQAAHAGLPLLADYTNYQLARAQYFAHQVAAALVTARSVSPDSVQATDAELLAGDCLRGTADWPGVVALYQGYLAKHPDGPRKAEARFRLAEALEQTAGDAAEIVNQYRRITIESPLSSFATTAAARLAVLAPAAPPLTAAEHIERGMELFDGMRNPESEAEFTAALADPTITVAQRCIAGYHQAQSRFKARDRTASSKMFDDAQPACHEAGNKDLEIKCLYQAGRAYAFIGQHETATARYQAAQLVDPTHSYADDAMLREAEEWTSRGDPKQVEAVLAALPGKFPQGDNSAEAMWRLGWQAWKAKDLTAAVKWWKQQIVLVPHDDNYFGEGQAQYWLGRAYAAQGNRAAAITSWIACVREYPAAYYALLALNRIREVDGKQFDALRAEISADPKGFDPKAPAFTFKPRVEYGTPGFQRALELLRLGLGEGAEAELRRLGLTAPSNKRRVDDPDQIEKLWAMAFLFDRAGRYDQSHWPTRWHILDYRRQWPVGANRARWQIAYPLAYADLLRKYVAIHGQPFALQIAIVREESAFDPLLESYANAIGLTQLVPVAAERFAKGTGVGIDRESLRDPEKNVIIGSNFLGYLYKYQKQFVLLVPPSYNGGEGYVKRSLKARGTQDCDEWVEGILDDQIRNYTKRVLGTFFTYSWLYEHTIPEIPNRFPAEVLPK